MNAPRQQRFVVIGRLCQRQALEHVDQPAVWIDPTALGGFNQRVDQRTGVRTSLGVGEEPGLVGAG